MKQLDSLRGVALATPRNLPADWRSDTQQDGETILSFWKGTLVAARSECFYHYTPLQSGHLFWPWEMVLKVLPHVCVCVCAL